MLIRIVRGTLISCAATVIVLLLAELATRMLGDDLVSLTVRDPEVGQRYPRSFTTEIYVPEAKRRIALRFNQEGFRGPSRETEKAPGVCRIAVLGDSHVAAIATREEDTLVAQLEKRLNHAGQAARWEVLNFGISGASTAQELALYRKVVRQYDPDLVICAYFEGNDFSDNSERLSGSPRIYMDIDAEGRLRQKPGSGTWSAGSGWLNRNSRFYVWQKIALRNAIANLRTAMDLGIDDGDLTFSLEPRDELRHAWKLTEALVRKFAEEVTADGREFLLLYIPTAETLYPELWQRKLRRRSYQRARLDPENALRHFRRIASEGEIDALFLNERFSSVIGGRRVSDRRAWLYFGANGHLNERAQALAADEIVDQLMRSGRLGACRSR